MHNNFGYSIYNTHFIHVAVTFYIIFIFKWVCYVALDFWFGVSFALKHIVCHFFSYFERCEATFGSLKTIFFLDGPKKSPLIGI